ncbi:hypothetical protein PF005_g4329 [Phytophthora fragariae]|uniref:Uncharacterized protein n=1 Tax=Phytophthora fragariae TaxID=53985 RepID=A0A6A4A5H1_9STRA|nr:hypothetical protein PF003_g15867 [Phytophthora fragariae]KAE8946516.1 hypothetical protein PF009_g3850 [Phytophthora fragariae]KAE9023917.1 hypothetical protein PF011_g3755 [Phytophthora fragariae]KAE9129837.1 hypothetical protein PF010_g4053 [Phytophthora fragariae]KAE9129929.1 hypothetical protein PF007_g4704 [Phytophthora fragariae]
MVCRAPLKDGLSLRYNTYVLVLFPLVHEQTPEDISTTCSSVDCNESVMSFNLLTGIILRLGEGYSRFMPLMDEDYTKQAVEDFRLDSTRTPFLRDCVIYSE